MSGIRAETSWPGSRHPGSDTMARSKLQSPDFQGFILAHALQWTIDMNINEIWARSTTSRIRKGGDLYRRPLTRTEMVAPLAWHEEHMASVWRYGELADGTIGNEKIK